MPGKKSGSVPFNLNLSADYKTDNYSESKSLNLNPAPNCDVREKKIEYPWYSSKPDVSTLEIDCPENNPENETSSEIENNIIGENPDYELSPDNENEASLSESEMNNLLEGNSENSMDLPETETNEMPRGDELSIETFEI